ncbi:MAG: DUF2235 domain-containing protein [Akkermansiaceae bacterium]|nr:DUF2235 domain-containing protein [Akkermansiaceae bacterium]
MSKNIAIFADGTWNRKDSGADTNVARLFDVTVNGTVSGERNPEITEQRSFYDPGVGTGALKLTGGIGGLGISKNIQDCYRFLVAHFEPGDRIFLFGFSRGAFTVRSLAGMLGKVGLMKREHASERRVQRAYRVYRGHAEYPHYVDEFRRQYCAPCPVHLIGVWDTVGALGIPVNALNRWNPFPHHFHDPALGKNVTFAYQALAIDEAREKFLPTLWTVPPSKKEKRKDQVVRQVWFAGMHADVGGGYLETSLSDIPLEWMAEMASAAGLEFTSEWEARLTCSHLGMMHDSRLGWKSLFRRKIRTLDGVPGLRIHRSVFRRMEDSSKWQSPYDPPNLHDCHYVVEPWPREPAPPEPPPEDPPAADRKAAKKAARRKSRSAPP